MKLRITADDLLRTKIVEPGWYPATVTKVDEHPSKAGDSINWDVTFQILGDKEAGVSCIRTFNEKAPGFAVPFLVACGAKEGPGEFDLAATTGRKLMIFIKTSMYNNKARNEVSEFRPI